MSLLALRISKDRLVENDDEPLMVVVRNEGEREREAVRGASRNGKLMERHVEYALYKSGSRERFTKIHNRVSIREWEKRGDPSSRPPLEKWLVKLIRAKWGLNGAAIDRAAGFCAAGTSRMFGHPAPYNYPGWIKEGEMRSCHQPPRAIKSHLRTRPFSLLLSQELSHSEPFNIYFTLRFLDRIVRRKRRRENERGSFLSSEELNFENRVD